MTDINSVLRDRDAAGSELARTKLAYQELRVVVKEQNKRIAELKEAAGRAAVLLNHATYHDGRYNQHTGFEWQKEACEVADILERLAQPPQQEGE